MRWSWRIARVAGIDIYMHATFLLLPVWVALMRWAETQNVAQAAIGVVFILALFACVVLHELGHAVTAQHYGIRTRDITLLPIGGVARLERMPDDPVQELWVALAGPSVNVVIAGVLWLIVGASQGMAAITGFHLLGTNFLASLMVVNVLLVVFNLIPAFPMDGGRVLRALLACKMDYVQATQIATTVGQAIAFAFAFLGFLRNPFLILIALFVYIGAAEEAAAVQMRSVFQGIPVLRAMQQGFTTLPRHGSLNDATQALLNGSQQDFPVVDDGRVVGMLFRRDLLAGIQEYGEDAALERVMRADVAPLEMEEMLDCAVQRMRMEDLPSLPVLGRGQLVGLLTLENIGEFVAIQSARKRWHGFERVV